MFLVHSKLLLILLLCSSIVSAQKNKYVEKVRGCYSKDKSKFDGCLLQFFQDITKMAFTGVPELNIPVMDPLFIDHIDFTEQSPAVQVAATFDNVTVTGASGAVTTGVRVDTASRLVVVNMTFPYLNCTGDYNLKGNVMLLPVDGEGRFALNMTGINSVVISTVVQKGTGVHKSKTEMDFTVDRIFLKFHDLLKGDTVGEAINSLINDNSQQVFMEIKPAIAKRLAQNIYNMTQEIYSNLPANAFIS